jgi:hypothetical protein
VTARHTAYFGFELDRERSWRTGTFPADLAEQARAVLAQSVVDGVTQHPRQPRISKAVNRLQEYWFRSGGTLEAARTDRVVEQLRVQLDPANSWREFLDLDLELGIDELIPADVRRNLDNLPSSAHVLGDRIPLAYELEGGKPVVMLRMREGQARRLRRRDLPHLDRPLHFSVFRGRREIVRAASLDELQARLQLLPAERKKHGRRRRRR